MKAVDWLRHNVDLLKINPNCMNLDKHIPEDVGNAVSTFVSRIDSSLCLPLPIIFIHMHLAAPLHEAKTMIVPASWLFTLVVFNRFISSVHIILILALLTQKFGATLPSRPRPLANCNVSDLTAISIDAPHPLFAIDTSVYCHLVAAVALF